MAKYIQFVTADGGIVVVEVASEGWQDIGGPDKNVIKAMETFQKTIMDTVRRNAEAFTQTLQALVSPPDEAELSFGIKATGELGNAAIAKVGTEGAYTVTLTWKRNSEKAPKS